MGEVILTLAVLAGILAGAGMMRRYQSKCRMEELQRISRLADEILEGRKLSAALSGEDTFPAKIEHQMVRLQDVLEGKSREAEKSRREIQKLISETAHQMRTPLANMETYAELLRGALEEEREASPQSSAMSEVDDVFRYLSALEESRDKLRFLVENFIKMSRLEQGLIQIRKEETDILKTVQNTLGQIQSQAEEKQIDLAIDLPREARCPHDGNWLGEAVYNLLDNGVKYSPVQGKLKVCVLKNEMFLKIRVEDKGIGIEPGEEAEIFRRFYRGKRVKNQEGFGIGLYLAREIVNRHGGFLTAKRMEPGLRMEISLPVSDFQRKDTAC